MGTILRVHWWQYSVLPPKTYYLPLDCKHKGEGGGVRMGVVRSGEMINDKQMGRIITSRGQTTEIPTIKENYWYSQSM